MLMEKLRIIIISICLYILCVFNSNAADWPQWGGANRDGHSPDVGLLKTWNPAGPPFLWKTTNIGAGFSSPVIVNGVVYITGDIGDDLFITALDMNGNKKWQIRHSLGWKGPRSPGSLGSPAVIDGKLYLLSAHGLLKCFSADTGEEKWQVDIVKAYNGTIPGWGYSESPLVYKNLVIVTPGGENCIVALDKETGEKVWTSKGLNDPAGYASCIAFDFQGHLLIVQLTEKGMVAVDARNGEFQWRNNRAVGGAACATPVYSDGYCFGATEYNNGGACVKLSIEGDKVQATQVWDTKEMMNHHGGFIIQDGHIYGNHKDGWNCLELTTGVKKWNGKGVGKGSLCYADGMLYTFGEGGGQIGLVHAKPDKFDQVGAFRVSGSGNSWAYPVVVGGRLYLRYHDNLYCYDVRGENYIDQHNNLGEKK